MIYEQMGSDKLLGDVEISGAKPVLVWSDSTRVFCIGIKGQLHNNRNARFLSCDGVWVSYFLAQPSERSGPAVELVKRFAANDPPIPYDEIDQEE